MRVLLMALIGAASLLSTTAPAYAQTVADKADARCVIALTFAGRDPKDAPKAQQGIFYFLGKMEGRGATPRLEGLMLSESKTLNTGPLVQTELTRCGAELTRRATALGAMFQRLQATRPSPPTGAAPQPK